MKPKGDRKMPKYQGHRNWNHWNVSLWLFNDEPMYRLVQLAVRQSATLDVAARRMVDTCLPSETPDGAPYSFTSVRAALQHWEG